MSFANGEPESDEEWAEYDKGYREGMERNAERDKAVHLAHCYQGEYLDTCKYGEPDCPAKRRWGEYRVPVLMIDTWSSTCAYCGLGADPNAKTHDKVLSMSDAEREKSACGVEWELVSSNYVGKEVEAWCKRMRPDLRYVDFFSLMNSIVNGKELE